MPQRIPSHKPPRLAGRPRRDDSKRPNAAARGYCDKAHRAWRQAVLTRDAWQCQACGRVCGDRREAHADHIVPVSRGGERYSVANGQCLCVSCHGRKTRGEQDEMRRGGVADPRAAGVADADTRSKGGSNLPNLRSKDPGCKSFAAVWDMP
jgi:5-methylcytosine-specific restriction endonuclease McrA